MSLQISRAVVVASLLLVGLEFGCSSTPKPAAAAPDDKGKGALKVAANFALKDATGADVKLSDYKGKVVLLNFWATWCGPCKVEIPWFMEFNKNYKDRGFTVVGISMDDDGWKSVKPYLAAKKIDYPVAIGNDELGKLYGGVESLPTTFIIDRGGNIAYTHMGLESKDTYEKEIAGLLKN
jgi:cytochrome c biogenesis protein CcmG/thiol:disulfide interchange protein DsbE